MKVLLINGSPNAKGNTYTALHEMEQIFRQEGVETEIIHVGNKAIRGCIGCRKCRETGKCVFNDIVNETAAKFEEADGLVLGSPVYYASANATLMAFALQHSIQQNHEGRRQRMRRTPRRSFLHL